MKKNIFIILLVLFSLFVFKSYESFVNIKDSVIRLHIIADSNDFADQAIKLKVRDYVLENYKFDNTNIDSNKRSVIADLNKISADVTDYLNKNGFDYLAKAKFGNSYFPTKSYGDLSFPCGNYNALEIVLGEGKGKNWWCVMYPPLCFTENSAKFTDQSKKELMKSISEGDYEMLLSKGNIKFKTVEIINKIIK